jgi:Tfp pilus assembly protein FimT
MKEQDNSCSHRKAGISGERGISIVELLIVVAMIGIVTAFAVIRIVGAQRALQLSNSSREFTAWLEKARLDSVRRHAMVAGEMASVTVVSANSYSIVIDQNGDGTLDPARTITIPATNGATFSGIAVPLIIRYNWRGRPVDTNGNLMNISFTIQDADGNVNPVNVASTGDISHGSNVNTSTVSVSGVSNTSNIKSKVSIP